jgi:predicted metal-dependent hydrolase
MVKQVRIHDLDVKYEMVHRNIRYPRLEFKTGELLLVLPMNCEDSGQILEKHKDWIYSKMSTILASIEDAEGKNLNSERTDREFREIVHSYVNSLSKELGLSFGNTYFRRMKTKWGSCSSKGNLTINKLLRYLPEEIIRYVIYHEIAHTLERRHTERFWRIIEREFEDHQEKEGELLAYWFLIQKDVEKLK